VRAALLLSVTLILAAGCGRKPATAVVTRPSGSVSTAGQPEAARTAAAREPARGPRRLNGVPPGHYPKAGECRLWVPGRPPGQQAPPTACARLRGAVPAGAFVLYGDRAFDADYDWAAEARRERGSVPDAILEILTRRR
jgi:hypothetical protein